MPLLKKCSHYTSNLDIVAIKFKCCNRYYPCYFCHQELARHPPNQWNRDEHHAKAILCLKCLKELTIEQYLTCESCCIYCNAPFNPRCKKHWHLYFDKNLLTAKLDPV